MKIKVEGIRRDYSTYLCQGCQRFTIHKGPKSECLWYARMLRKALKNYGVEVIENRRKSHESIL